MQCLRHLELSNAFAGNRIETVTGCGEYSHPVLLMAKNDYLQHFASNIVAFDFEK